MKIIHGGSGEKVRGLNADETLKVFVDKIDTPATNTGQFTRVTNDIEELVTPGTYVDKIFSISSSKGSTPVTPTVVTSDPSVCTIISGQPDRVTDGIAKLSVTHEDQTRQINQRIYRTTVQEELVEFAKYVDGSLGGHINSEISSRISGKARSADTESLFTPSTHGQTVDDLTRNVSLWCSDIDFTGVAASTIPAGRGCAVISPRHIASATHYRPSTVSFVLSDNSVITRAVTQWSYVKNKAGTANEGENTDLAIGYLDSDLPGQVKIYKVLPDDYASYLPSIATSIPAIYTSHSSSSIGASRFARLQEISQVNRNYLGSHHEVEYKRIAFMESGEYAAWSLGIGLSGEPTFALINGELIYLSENHTNAPSGVLISDLIPEVNAIMATQHGNATHQLQTVDLSGFPTYP